MSSQSLPRTVSQESADSIRKRVCKACDRCRLKKSKCDGSHPCSRCKADNAICVFGERKRSHDKVYPKGYVEMLEQQQAQLVSGLQEMYQRLVASNSWTGTPLESESNGHPLTHDILAALGLLEAKRDGSGEMELFEDDTRVLQDRLLSQGAGFVQRRGSISSDSEHSQRPHHSRNASHSTPTLGATPVFKDPFSFGSPTSSPTVQSPAQIKSSLSRPSYTTQSSSNMRLQQQFLNQVQRSHSPLANDPQLYQPDWAIPDMSTPEQVIRNKLALQTSGLNSHQTHHGTPVHRSAPPHPHPLQQQQVMSQLYQQQQALFEQAQYDANTGSAFVDSFTADMQMAAFTPGLLQNGAVDFGMDPMDMELNKFISVTT